MNKNLFKALLTIVLLNLMLVVSGSLLFFISNESLFYLVLSLFAILILLIFSRINKLKIDYSFNNFKKALILIWPAYITLLINVVSVDYSLVTTNIIIKAICISLFAALNEELLIRIVPINYYVNKETNRNYIALSIGTSIIFAFFHLSNVFVGANLIMTLLQIIQTFGMGVLFSSVYIKTRNMYPLIICHFLFDFFALLIPEISETGGIMNGLYLDIGTIIQTLLAISFIVVGLKLLRDNKEEIESIWE